MKTYSFQEVVVTLTHPSLESLTTNGMGIGSISENMTSDRTSMDVGADGVPVISKIRDRRGSLSITMQQVSDLHNSLKRWYNYLESAPSSEWANIKAVITSKATGEQDICTGTAFVKLPDKSYEATAGNVTWDFMCADVQQNII